MTVTIGSVTEGNANAEEIKNNSPDSELYEKNKKYLQGSLVKFNDKIYLAKRNVPSDVDLDNPYYWEIFMDAADSKRVDELFEKTGNLDELETESKDNLVAAINEVGSIQPDWAQNDETAKDYIKNRTHWIEEKTVLEETTFTIEESDNSFVLGNFPVTLSDGDICTVVYDGKTYTCTVFEFGTDIAGISCDAFEIAFQNQPDGLCAITIGSYAGEHTISILQTTYHTIPDEFIPWEESPTATSVLYTAQSLTEEQKVQARQNIGAQDLYNCVQTNKENILGDNGSIISNSSRGNSLTISNGVIEQKNSNQNTISLGDAKVVFSYDSDGSSSTRGNGTFAMYGKKGEEYFKFKATNGDVKVSGIATPTLSNDAVNKSYVDLQIANIEIPTVPTNVSAFTNDAGYLTEHQSLADYALKSEIPSPYSLPTASATELGGVKADSAEAADTQPVRIGGDGKLYTAASGADISLGLTSASVGQIIKVKAVDESGKPTAWEAADMPSGGGSNGGIHLIARVVTEANAASIEVTGLSTTAEVLSLRIYNPGSTCGGGLCIAVNGIRKLGYGGTISGTNTIQAFVRAWLYRDGGTLYGRSRMANEGTNVYEWPEMGEITSITVDSTYNDGTTKYFQAGTIFEIYEGMYPNVQ